MKSFLSYNLLYELIGFLMFFSTNNNIIFILLYKIYINIFTYKPAIQKGAPMRKIIFASIAFLVFGISTTQAQNCFIEYDSEKSRSNLIKHGIDFVKAQELWDDPNLLEVQAKSDDEPRFLIIARIAKSHWSAIITYRSSAVRIISVRRSRKKEVEVYES